MIEGLDKVSGKAEKCLTFTFFKEGEIAILRYIGLSRLYSHKAETNQQEGFAGIIRPWGDDIPVVDLELFCRKNTNRAKDASCIVVFEYSQKPENRFGLIVDDIAHVINISKITENQMAPILISAKRHLLPHPGVN